MIDAISSAIAATAGVTLLDVDPGHSTNRTVITFVADPEAVVEGALNGARAAAQHIDMTRHKGQVQSRAPPKVSLLPETYSRGTVQALPWAPKVSNASLYNGVAWKKTT